MAGELLCGYYLPMISQSMNFVEFFRSNKPSFMCVFQALDRILHLPCFDHIHRNKSSKCRSSEPAAFTGNAAEC
jgi:hypothetical protein